MTMLNVYNLDGKKVSDVELSDATFALPSNNDLLHQVYTILSGNQRTSTAHTKIRSERRGGGKKPWKQKGTGSARAGSRRSPLWRKGGIIFGPLSDRNFSRFLNTKMRRKAFNIALSEKVRNNQFYVIENFDFSKHKTVLFAKLFDALKLSQSTVVVTGIDEIHCIFMSRNIPFVTNQSPEKLNVMDLLDHQNVVISRSALSLLEKRTEL